MLEDGLVTLITADSGVSALIGTRLYPVQGPPDNPTYPYVTYQNIAGAPTDYTFENIQSDHTRIQFDIWCLNAPSGGEYGQSKAILKAFSNLLSGFAGTLTDGTRILFASKLNEMDSFENSSRSYRSIGEYDFQVSPV